MPPVLCLFLLVVSSKSESQFVFQTLSSTEGEAGDEGWRGVDLLPVGQVGAKHQQLAGAQFKCCVYKQNNKQMLLTPPLT